MNNVTKAKEWIKQNAPMLAVLYENKYIGMIYDRFASLPQARQRQYLLTGIGLFSLLIFGGLLTLYISVWSEMATTDRAQSMTDMLLKFQKVRRSQEADLQQLEKNRGLSNPESLRQYLIDQGKVSNISPRMMKAEEKPDTGPDASKGTSDIAIKRATVRLEKINLIQLKDFLRNVEFGTYSLIVSSVQIANDDKIRGYMNVELGVVAYLLKSEDEGSL